MLFLSCGISVFTWMCMKLCEDILNLLPEIRLRKEETGMNIIPKVEKIPLEVSNPIISKADFGLMKFLSYIGIVVTPLGGGLILGALYGIIHAIVGINKNIVGIQSV